MLNSLSSMIFTLLAVAVLLSPVHHRRYSTAPTLDGQWISVPLKGSKIKESLRFDKPSTFTVKIQKPGKPALVGTGTYRLVSPDPVLRKIGAKQVVMLFVDFRTALQFGMPKAEAKMLARRKERQAMLTRLFFVPNMPAVTDFKSTLFARRGQEAKVARKFHSLPASRF